MSYNYVQKISTRDPSKTSSRPLWGRDSQAQNHWSKRWPGQSAHKQYICDVFPCKYYPCVNSKLKKIYIPTSGENFCHRTPLKKTQQAVSSVKRRTSTPSRQKLSCWTGYRHPHGSELRAKMYSWLNDFKFRTVFIMLIWLISLATVRTVAVQI